MSQSFLTSYAILGLALISQTFHSTYSNPTGISMKMITRDSPESPLYPGNLTQLQRVERLVQFSKARAQYLQASISSNISVFESRRDVAFPLFPINYLFFVEFMIGTPSVSTYLAMDTGSSIVWTQCLPCPDCYPQFNAIFNSTSSTSFVNLPCTHPLCSGPGAMFECVRGLCEYRQSYASGQTSEGVLAMETVGFLRSDGSGDPLNDFIFGCAKKSTSFRNWANTVRGGILGLSWGQPSIVAQLGNRSIRRHFSYCLKDPTSNRPSTLSFGDAVPIPPPNIRSTGFLPPPRVGNPYYYLDLLDISVGSKRLGFPPGTFAIGGGEGGFIIDSGTALTHLPQNSVTGVNPYIQVLGAFEELYNRMELLKAPSGVLNHCYKYPDGFDQFVSLTFHFAGADYVVDGKYVNLFSPGNSFCVAILPEDTISLLGAAHQQYTRFIYDGNDADSSPPTYSSEIYINLPSRL